MKPWVEPLARVNPRLLLRKSIYRCWLFRDYTLVTHALLGLETFQILQSPFQSGGSKKFGVVQLFYIQKRCWFGSSIFWASVNLKAPLFEPSYQSFDICPVWSTYRNPFRQAYVSPTSHLCHAIPYNVNVFKYLYICGWLVYKKLVL